MVHGFPPLPYARSPCGIELCEAGRQGDARPRHVSRQIYCPGLLDLGVLPLVVILADAPDGPDVTVLNEIGGVTIERAVCVWGTAKACNALCKRDKGNCRRPVVLCEDVETDLTVRKLHVRVEHGCREVALGRRKGVVSGYLDRDCVRLTRIGGVLIFR